MTTVSIGWRARLPEMGEDLGDHVGMLDGSDGLQGAAALGAVLHIDLLATQ